MMMSKTVRFPHDRVAKKDRTLEKKHVLNRSVAGTIKRLNELLRGENVDKVIFSQDARLLRYKLKENLLQLMFMEPEEYGQRAEELIWSKGFYSVIVKVRQCTRQGLRLSRTLEMHYRNHLLQGIGFYQDLSLRLQNNYNLRLHKGIDFARPPPNENETVRHGLGSSLYLGCGLLDAANVDSFDEEELMEQRQKRLKKWALEAVHRCLIYMGDLTRYQHDFFRENGAGRCIATRYYSQALLLLPDAGLPFNQLAALDAASGQFHMLFAVYDYWRCLLAVVPFDGARQNLTLLLERNSKRYAELNEVPPPPAPAPQSGTGPPPQRQLSEEQTRVKDVKKLIIKFLVLTQKFSKTKHEQGDILLLAKDVLTEVDMCMFAVQGLSCRFSSSGAKAEEGVLMVHDLSRPKHLPDAAVFRCLVICIAVWHQLSFNSASAFAARAVQAFIMSFFSIVLNQAVSRMQNGLKDALGLDDPVFALPSAGSSDEAEDIPPAENVNHFGAVGERLDRTSGLARRRRRGRRPCSGEPEALGSEDEEEDLSEDELEQDSASNNDLSSEGRNSFLVEESEEEEEDEDDYFLMDISSSSAQEHRNSLGGPSLGFGASGELQSVPEEVASNGGGSGTGASQEATEEWGTEAVRALKELKERLMLESGDASSRLLPFLASNQTPAARPGSFELQSAMQDDNVEEGSDEAFCREVSMKVANFSIENDNEVPPDDEEEAPAGCFIETWPEECAADLLLQQKMEEEASRGELLARRFAIIGKTDLLWCSTLMEAFIRVADIENDGEGIPLALLGHFATLLNMLNHVDEAVEKGAIQLRPELKALERKDPAVGEPRFPVALAEDQQLRGFTPLQRFQESLDFGVRPPSVEEQALIRADRLLALGHRLAAHPKVDFSYNETQAVFLGPSSLRPSGMGAAISALESGSGQGPSPHPQEESALNGLSHSGTVGQRRFAASEARRNRLMRDMAQLRLKSEIQRLEASVEVAGAVRTDRAGDLGLLPPYLLPHTQVLCAHLGAVRRLVQARRFIVVVPEAVVDHLDLLKKQEPRAREVIRFLESESHRGNCFLRLQRNSEQITGQSEAPRRVWNSRLRGPEAEWHRWASMLCCARYFARQAGPPPSAKGLVALLWTEGAAVSPSVQAEAGSEGILIEFFPDFYSKWKQTREKG